MNPPTAERFVTWLETGTDPGDLFAPDVFLDLSVPQWRLQARGSAEVIAVRTDDHPWKGQVTVERLDETARGWVLQMAERWIDDTGASWYCREMFRADIADDRIQELAVSCTGDWDTATVDRHAAEVELLRP